MLAFRADEDRERQEVIAPDAVVLQGDPVVAPARGVEVEPDDGALHERCPFATPALTRALPGAAREAFLESLESGGRQLSNQVLGQLQAVVRRQLVQKM